MNYAQLVTAIEEYTETSEATFVSQIPNFVQLAEERIYNTVDLPSLRKNVTGTLTINNKYLSTPGDFLSVFSLAVINAAGEYEYLLNKDVNFIRDAYPFSSMVAEPKHYAIFGPQSANVNELSFILGPTPDANYNAELHYYYFPESIVTAGTTWLGDNFDTALLNGCLCEAITFMKGEGDLVALYAQRYGDAMLLLKQLGDGKYLPSALAGKFFIGIPNSSGFGNLETGYVEGSNVDITTEMTNMIRAQQQFNGSARMMQTNSDMIEKMTR